MKGVNYRETRGMPYVRREYIAGKPQLKIARFSSGLAGNNYDYKIELVATEKLQIRHNALEAARLAANKRIDRKSTRLNSSHANISYAVFCLKKKKKYYSPYSCSFFSCSHT